MNFTPASPRGLVYKALTRFTLAPGDLSMNVAPTVRHLVDSMMNVATLALPMIVIAKLWRRTTASPHRSRR